MASITNKHHTPLGLPNGTTLSPGVATNVQDWDEIKDNAVLKAWEKAGILAVDSKPVPAAEEKEQLQARLDELEVSYDKRAGVAKLRELVADAEKANAGGDGTADTGATEGEG